MSLNRNDSVKHVAPSPLDSLKLKEAQKRQRSSSYYKKTEKQEKGDRKSLRKSSSRHTIEWFDPNSPQHPIMVLGQMP